MKNVRSKKIQQQQQKQEFVYLNFVRFVFSIDVVKIDKFQRKYKKKKLF